ncbi:amino acid permease/ SLC12A domain-containing protein [Amylostereum chailletii]|nr:amino acid permease/ SLC12A domain-containing protein [Amylostereum chailletii]
MTSYRIASELLLCEGSALPSSPLLRPDPAVLVGFWDTNANHTGIYVAAFIIVAYTVNLIGSRSFGNTEIVFSTLKLMLVAGLTIGGLVISLGGGPDHKRRGFQYWRDPGPFVSSLAPGARGRWIGILLAITPAAFAMNGMEILTLAAAETRNPRRNMRIAMKTVFFRIFFCYILTTFVIGMLVPSTDPSLLKKTGTAAQSPFVLVFERAGVEGLPHIVNAVVLTSAVSSGNGMLFSASRMLFSLGVQGHAPKIFTRVTHDGVPYVAILSAGSFSFLAFLNVNNAAGQVFNWFASLSTVGGLLSALMIGVTYLRFYYGLKKQGITRSEIPGMYRFKAQPFAAMWVVFWSTFFILVSGIGVFWNFNGPDFVAAYINLPVYALLFIGWKIWKKTKVVPLSELDFVTNIPSVGETEDGGLIQKTRGLRRMREFV